MKTLAVASRAAPGPTDRGPARPDPYGEGDPAETDQSRLSPSCASRCNPRAGATRLAAGTRRRARPTGQSAAGAAIAPSWLNGSVDAGGADGAGDRQRSKGDGRVGQDRQPADNRGRVDTSRDGGATTATATSPPKAEPHGRSTDQQRAAGTRGRGRSPLQPARPSRRPRMPGGPRTAAARRSWLPRRWLRCAVTPPQTQPAMPTVIASADSANVRSSRKGGQEAPEPRQNPRNRQAARNSVDDHAEEPCAGRRHPFIDGGTVGCPPTRGRRRSAGRSPATPRQRAPRDHDERGSTSNVSV